MEIKYVKVALNLATSKKIKAFTYKTKENTSVLIGSLVIVPFRNSLKIGYVVAFENSENLKNIKEIEEVIAEMSISKESSEIAAWIAKTYLCSHWSAARLFLPPGSFSKIKKQYYLTKKTDKYDSKKPLSLKKIKDIFNEEPEELIKRGYLKSRYTIDGLKPKTTSILKRKEKDKENGLSVKQKQLLLIIEKYGVIERKKALSLASCSGSVAKNLISKGYVEENEKPFLNEPKFIYSETYEKPKKLTQEQEKAIWIIRDQIKQKKHKTFLLNGITGSGKTEVYAQVIEAVLKSGKSAIFLVPEIAMSVQVVARLTSRFRGNVAVLHSALTKSQRISQWKMIRDGRLKIVIGARSAIFAPLKNIGVVIVDEEHESAYKQNRTPRYNARDLAIKRAQISGAVCVLGSATPSLESRYKCLMNKYKQLLLQEKPSGSKVHTELIDMRKVEEKALLSQALVKAMGETIKAKQKVLLFLNRRGFSAFLLCPECGYVAKCQNCSVSLTYHKTEKRLKCHHCDFSKEAPKICPNCSANWFRFASSGTQKLEEIVKDLFPKEIVVRVDGDNKSKDLTAKLLKLFKEADSAIMLGTQIIGKGLDFKDITLVGIINADTSLNFPDFRAAERTFQLIHQVAGRAGRGSIEGRVIIQTYNSENYAIRSALKGKYEDFFKKEIKYRKELNYPPFSRLINIGFSSFVYEKAKNAADELAAKLRRFSKIEVLGAAEAPIGRIKNRFRFHILIKTPEIIEQSLLKVLGEFKANDVNIAVDIDPVSLL